MNTTAIYKTPEGEKAVMALYEAALQNWPVPHETLNVSTRHGNTFVVASGPESAPPLVLLHGAGTNSAIWAGDIAGYSRLYRTFAVDLIGEAGHSAPNRPDWKGPAFTEWFEDVLRGLKIEKTAVVGISQGGWVALKYAVANPDRIEKLALICPGGVIPDRLSFVFKALLYSLTGKWGIKRMVQLLYADQQIPEKVEEVTAIVVKNFRSRMGVLPIFSDEELQGLKMPALLIGGTKDALRHNDRIAARLKKFMPELEIALVPGAGHAVINTGGRILAFLASSETAADKSFKTSAV